MLGLSLPFLENTTIFIKKKSYARINTPNSICSNSTIASINSTSILLLLRALPSLWPIHHYRGRPIVSLYLCLYICAIVLFYIYSYIGLGQPPCPNYHWKTTDPPIDWKYFFIWYLYCFPNNVNNFFFYINNLNIYIYIYIK